jgi:hypothetical protein
MRKLFTILLTLVMLVVQGCSSISILLNPDELRSSPRHRAWSTINSVTLGPYWWEDIKMDVLFDKFRWYPNSRRLEIKGTVVYLNSYFNGADTNVVPGISIYIAATDSDGIYEKIHPTVNTITDSFGRFELETTVNKNEWLIFLRPISFMEWPVMYDLNLLFERKNTLQ